MLYPPTLVAGIVRLGLAREEIFGPVLVTTTFRTPDEAVALANNTRYGLAASVWSENVNRALEVALASRPGSCGSIRPTCSTPPRASAATAKAASAARAAARACSSTASPTSRRASRIRRSQRRSAPRPADPSGAIERGVLDRTAKLYSAASRRGPTPAIATPSSIPPAARWNCGLGNRKDVRNAVEAAAKAASWGAATAHNRAQVLYYVAENLSARASEFARRLSAMTGASARAAEAEVEASIRRAFVYAAHADKFDGAVHATRSRFVTLAMNEPWGVMGIVCPNEAPLLALVSLVMPAIAMGNCVVAVPSASHPLSATDLYSVLDTSDVPAGVVDIVTGETNALAKTLAEHDGVDALWYVGDAAGAAQAEALSAGNLKATWAPGSTVDWRNAEGREFLRRATQVKNIWTPYGE